MKKIETVPRVITNVTFGLEKVLIKFWPPNKITFGLQ